MTTKLISLKHRNLFLLLTVVCMNEVICHISDEELVKGPKGTKGI